MDECLGRIYQALRPRGGAWIITADHGNAETMIDPVTGGPHTYHTTNPVPFILASDDGRMQLQPGGSLRDIAPTLLGVLGLARAARNDRTRFAQEPKISYRVLTTGARRHYMVVARSRAS